MDDYTALNRQEVTFSPGEFTRSVPIATLSDLPAEGNEDFFATLSAIDSRVSVTEPEATVIITEDGK